MQRGEKLITHPLPLQGPVRPFTVFQDLERGYIEALGLAQQGPFRFRLIVKEGSLHLIALKGPIESALLAPSPGVIAQPKEHLSLGVNKKQDWQMVCRRSLPSEILSFWLRLAHWTPQIPLDPKETRGTYALLRAVERAIKEKEKTKLASLLQTAFEGCFEGMLVPRLDDGYLGLIKPEQIPKNLSPIPLLHLGSTLIRSLFITFESDQIALLPALPPEFHAGRLLHTLTPHGDILSIEWSKKQLKKVQLKAGSTRVLSWKLQRSLRSYRIREGRKKRGERVSVKERLEIQTGREYFLDRFEK